MIDNIYRIIPTDIDVNTEHYQLLSNYLNEAIKENKIKKICLKGAKGSGKTSFLNTFVNENHYNARFISFDYFDTKHIPEDMQLIYLLNCIINQMKCKHDFDFIKLKVACIGIHNEIKNLYLENKFLKSIKSVIKKNKIDLLIFEDLDVVNFKLLRIIETLSNVVECKIIVSFNYDDKHLRNNTDVEDSYFDMEKYFDVIFPMYRTISTCDNFNLLYKTFVELLKENNEYSPKTNRALIDILLRSSIYLLDRRKINNLLNMVIIKMKFNKKLKSLATIYYTIEEFLLTNNFDAEYGFNSMQVSNEEFNKLNQILELDELPNIYKEYATESEFSNWLKLFNNIDDSFEIDYGVSDKIKLSETQEVPISDLNIITEKYITDLFYDSNNEEELEKFKSKIIFKNYSLEQILRLINYEFFDWSTFNSYSFYDLLNKTENMEIGNNIMNYYDINFFNITTEFGYQIYFNLASLVQIENDYAFLCSNIDCMDNETEVFNILNAVKNVTEDRIEYLEMFTSLLRQSIQRYRL